MNFKKNNSPIDNKTTKAYFSAIAEKKGINSASNVDKFDEIERLLIPFEYHRDILECGGGAGFYTHRLLESGYRVTCVDLSGEALAVNRKNAQKKGKKYELNTVESDFVDFCNNNKNKFDQVLFIKVLHHFSSLNDIKCAIWGAVKHCNSAGRVVIFEPNGDNPLWRLILSFQRGMSGKSKWYYEQNMKFTTTKKISRILEQIQSESNLRFDYRVTYHYIIPAMITKKYKKTSFINKINKILEDTWIRKWFAFNISIVIDLE